MHKIASILRVEKKVSSNMDEISGKIILPSKGRRHLYTSRIVGKT
jgi:hypothetical protein